MTEPEISGMKHFLPELCLPRSVLLLALGGELLALLLLLGTTETPARHGWATQLAYSSLFIQWTVLVTAGLLCLGRRLLNRLPVALNTCCCFLLVAIVLTTVHYVAFGAGHLLPGMQWMAEGGLVLLLKRLGIAFITTGLALRYFYLRHALRLRVEAGAQARIEALQARIRPHFLFNSLNTLISMVHEAPRQAEQMLEDLAELFRRSLQSEQQQVTLEQELELGRCYLRMEQSRLGERLRVRWDLEELPGSLKMPPLLLQPLLENAVYHGIELLPSGGEIRIQGRVHSDRLELRIENPVDESTLRRPNSGLRQAQENIQRRLEIHYGGKAHFHYGRKGDCYRAELLIPVQEALCVSSS